MIGVPYRVGIPHTPFIYDLPDFRGLSAIPIRRFLEYKDIIEPGRMFPTYQIVNVTTSPLLDLAAVRYVATTRRAVSGLLDGDKESVLVYDDGQVRIFENRAAVSRAWITHTAWALRGETEAVQELKRKTIGAFRRHARDVGLLQGVYLEPNERGLRPPEQQGLPVSADEHVRILEHGDPDRLKLDVELARPGYVVLADTYYPGWRATSDGAPVAIYPADLLFRAVFLPAGHHVVELEYRSMALRAGAAIALAALIGCAWLLRAARSRRFRAAA